MRVVRQKGIERSARLFRGSAAPQIGNHLQTGCRIAPVGCRLGCLEMGLARGRIEGRHLKRPGAVGAPKQEQHQAVNDKRDPAQDRRRRKIVDHAPVANRQKQTEDGVIEQGKIDLEAKSPQAKVLHRAAVIAAQNQPQQRAKC